MFNSSLNNSLGRGNKEEITTWGIPDYSAGISLNISEESYTAPMNGIICLYVYFGGVSYSKDITINGVFFGHLYANPSGNWEGNGYSIIIPVSKGDIVAGLPTYTQNSPKKVFYPLKGAN